MVVRNLPKVQQGSEDLTLGLRNKTRSNLEKRAWRKGAGGEVWGAGVLLTSVSECAFSVHEFVTS